MATAKKEVKIPESLVFNYYSLVLTLQEPMIGTVPKDAQVYQDYIESKKA